MSERISAHEQDDNLILNYYQDLEPTLQAAADDRRAEAEQSTQGSEWRLAMRVPTNIWMAVCARLGIDAGDVLGDPDLSKRVFAELKRPEFRAFRTVNDKRI